MWRQFLNDYFTFTRKERTGIVAILFAIVLLWFLPDFFESTDHKLTAIQIEEIKNESSKFEHTLQAQDTNDYPAVAFEKEMLDRDDKSKSTHITEMFEFDPNTLSADGWSRLGLKEKTINTIQHYLAKGGRFREPRDIGKIYGLSKDDYERLLPFVRIRGYDKKQVTITGNSEPISKIQERRPQYFALPLNHKVDINTADSAEWARLPGIGPKLSTRIIKFKDRLGGFYDVKQVSEIYGLADSVFQKIKTYLIVTTDFKVTTININVADTKTLQDHPYISFAIANAIVQYRTQHGLFENLNDLQKIGLISPEWLAHVKRYLAI